MDDLGFNGTGSRFNTRFGSNSDVLGKQLNDLSYGVQAGLPQPFIGQGQSVAFTSGGALISPDIDTNGNGFYRYNDDPPQFKCVVYVDNGDVAGTKYFLKIARGTITATGTNMPFTQGSEPTLAGGANFYTSQFLRPCQQRMIFDVAVSPQGSRTKGPFAQSTSPWMAYNGKFELNPEELTYYVTASFFDYDDQKDWYVDDRLIHAHEPWVSLVTTETAAKDSIFSLGSANMTFTTLCPAPGDLDPPEGSIIATGVLPTRLGYAMKVIAIIEWKEEEKMWKVTQQVTGPISFEIPFVTITDGGDTVYPPYQFFSYNDGLNNKFLNFLSNSNYVSKFQSASFAGYKILNDEDWWYDPKDWG
jgi:hypothetical protein